MTAALAFQPHSSPAHEPVNDNIGKTDADRWRWLIAGLKGVDSGLAVYAAQRKLAGDDVREFCELLIVALTASAKGRAR